MSYDSYNRSSNAYHFDYAPVYEDVVVGQRLRKPEKRNQTIIDNRRRAERMNVLVVFKISVQAFLLMLACCAMVHFYTSERLMKNKIADKEAQYNLIVRENEDFKNELTKNINIPGIKRKAKKLGMKRAKGNNIRYYETCCEEYVMQIEEFPIK